LRWRKRERRRMEKNQEEAQEEMRTQDRGVYSEKLGVDTNNNPETEISEI